MNMRHELGLAEYQISEEKGRAYKEAVLSMVSHPDANCRIYEVKEGYGRVAHGSIDIKEKVIHISKKMWHSPNDVRGVLIVLHELGHLFDMKYHHQDCVHIYHKSYMLGTMTLEFRAWLFAAYMAKSIGFTEWEAFGTFMNECLGSYARVHVDPMVRDSYMNDAFKKIATAIGTDLR